MKRVLCIWFPRWPLQRLYDVRPALKNKMLVFYQPEARGALRVVACSSRAQQRGIRPGMTVAEARALVRSQQVLQLERYDSCADRAALEQLALECEPFSPTVGLEEASAPESLLLDVTGSAPLLGGESALMEQVVRQFSQRGFVVRAALADTVGAAWAMAHYAMLDDGATTGETNSDPYAAFRIPQGASALIVPVGQTEAALAMLPIEALRLSPDSLQWLEELGIRQIGQLTALPRQGLAARQGQQLLRRYDQATGRAPEVIAHHHRPMELEADWSFETATGRRELIESALAQQLEQLTDTLAARRHGVQQLTCRLRCDSGAVQQVTLGLLCPSAKPQHLLELLRLRLEGFQLEGPVAGLCIQVSATAPLPLEQQELFCGSSPANDWRQLATLVNRLSSRLGREAVLRARPWPEAQPEYAWRCEPWIGFQLQHGLSSGQPRKHGSKSQPPGKNRSPRHRPLRLAAQPLGVSVTSVVPDGPPLRFLQNHQEYRIVRHWGPERIETGWWRSRAARRDYYRVETSTGHRFWLFRRLTDGQWFLHGWFD